MDIKYLFDNSFKNKPTNECQASEIDTSKITCKTT